MIPVQDCPGHYWRTNDAVDLHFNEAGTEQPQIVRCFNMQDHLNSGEARNVPVEGLSLLAPGIFGAGRPCRSGSNARWTGDSYRYGIYRNPAGLYKDGIVILERHGGGMQGYAFDSIVAGETWGLIAHSFSTEMIWNLCNQMANAYRAARDAEKVIVFRAFADGRLKKSRRNHTTYVHMEQAMPVLPTVGQDKKKDEKNNTAAPEFQLS